MRYKRTRGVIRLRKRKGPAAGFRATGQLSVVAALSPLTLFPGFPCLPLLPQSPSLPLPRLASSHSRTIPVLLMATDSNLIASSSAQDPKSAQSAPGWDNDYSSYAGSYGSNSEWGQNDNDAAHGGLGAFGDDAYNPTDFDASPPDYSNLTSNGNPGQSLNFFDHENLQPDVLADLDLQAGQGQQFISLSFTPAEPFHKHHNNPPSPFVNPSDLSSPGSSPGSAYNGDGRHSRASSVGSHHSPLLHHPQLATTGASPPTSPPEIKAASPPALLIPSESSAAPTQPTLSQGLLLPGTAGIDINIVPSTPISPGAAGASVPFQTVLRNLSQGGRSRSASPGDNAGTFHPGICDLQSEGDANPMFLLSHSVTIAVKHPS